MHLQGDVRLDLTQRVAEAVTGDAATDGVEIDDQPVHLLAGSLEVQRRAELIQSRPDLTARHTGQVPLALTNFWLGDGTHSSLRKNHGTHRTDQS